MGNYKIFLIKAFTFLGGLYFVLKFVLPADNALIEFDSIHEHVINGFTVVGSLAVGLGILNLVYVHGGKVIFKKSQWFFSAALLVGLVLMLWVQGLDWYRKEQNASKVSQLAMLAEFSKRIVSDSEQGTAGVLPREQRETLLRDSLASKINIIQTDASEELRVALSNLSDIAASLSAEAASHKAFQDQVLVASALYRAEIDKNYTASPTSNLSNFLNQGLFVALGSAMFSLLGFYIAAAAYRAFRVRSVEASLMMFAALIVMLGQIPFGMWISSSNPNIPSIPEIRLWLLQVPSAGAARAIEVGAAIAGLVLAVRMWLSLETSSFKGSK